MHRRARKSRQNAKVLLDVEQASRELESHHSGEGGSGLQTVVASKVQKFFDCFCGTCKDHKSGLHFQNLGKRFVCKQCGGKPPKGARALQQGKVGSGEEAKGKQRDKHADAQKAQNGNRQMLAENRKLWEQLRQIQANARKKEAGGGQVTGTDDDMADAQESNKSPLRDARTRQRHFKEAANALGSHDPAFLGVEEKIERLLVEGHGAKPIDRRMRDLQSFVARKEEEIGKERQKAEKLQKDGRST